MIFFWQIKIGFTGIDAPYETPQNADLTIDTSIVSSEQAVQMIFNKLIERVIESFLFVFQKCFMCDECRIFYHQY